MGERPISLTLRCSRGGRGGGGGRGYSDFFFLDDRISAPEVFCSCSFIPRAHFETSLVMVNLLWLIFAAFT